MITRRELLKSAAATRVLAGTSGLAMPAIAQGAAIKLGYVSPQRPAPISIRPSDRRD